LEACINEPVDPPERKDLSPNKANTLILQNSDIRQKTAVNIHSRWTNEELVKTLFYKKNVCSSIWFIFIYT
jgi:hypothetical protein